MIYFHMPVIYFLNLCIGISMFPCGVAPQTQNTVKTAMDGSLRDFEKVSQEGLTCDIVFSATKNSI